MLLIFFYLWWLNWLLSLFSLIVKIIIIITFLFIAEKIAEYWENTIKIALQLD